MKKIITYLAIVISVGACFDRDVVGPTITPPPVNLGMPSLNMNVVSTSGPVVSTTYTITLDVTQGAVYSLQLNHINGNIVHNHPFTAQSARVTVTVNYANVPNGAYDLYLMNTSGQELKVPVIIKH
jgi:sporulation protein YlmC with PRC-barrel domain